MSDLGVLILVVVVLLAVIAGGVIFLASEATRSRPPIRAEDLDPEAFRD